MGGALLCAVHQVCSEWVEQLPQLTQVPGEIEISFHAIKNTRRKMEDRHALCVDINSLFGLKVRRRQYTGTVEIRCTIMSKV